MTDELRPELAGFEDGAVDWVIRKDDGYRWVQVSHHIPFRMRILRQYVQKRSCGRKVWVRMLREDDQ